MMSALLAALTLFAAPGPELTLIHGDEHLATWLDAESMRQDGDVTRVRMLRVRGADQAFWLVKDVNCEARTAGLVNAYNVEDDPTPPALDGSAAHLWAPDPDDRLDIAVIAAVCDGARPYPWAEPVNGVGEAIAAAAASRDQAVAERPLELIPIEGDGRFVRFLDRATLDGGGPQWEFRALQIATEGFEVGGEAFIGGWTYWEVDCDQWRRQTDLLAFASIREDGSLGPRTPDDAPAEEPVRDGDAWPLWVAACAEDVWDREVVTSLDEAIRLGREALAAE